MNIKKIKDYLEKSKVKFEELAHKTVYTAYDAAQTLKVKLQEIGKPLVVKADGRFMLVILPANRQLDIVKLKKELKVKKLEIVSEKVISKAFALKDEAIGAFGQLRQLPVYVDKNILKNKSIILATGDFGRSVKMAVKDFIKLEQAVVKQISKTKEFKVAKAKVQKKINKILKKPAVKKIVKKIKTTKKVVKIIKKAVAKKTIKKVVKKRKN